jgi:large subunit ribosomal protein L24
VKREAPIHVSNVMFYVEKIKRPVRLRYKLLEEGKKVRGYLDPTSKTFVQVD